MRRYILLLLVSSLSLVALLPFSVNAWTGSPPSANLPTGIDPIASYNSLAVPDITANDSFFVYKQGANPDRVYMFVAYGTNQIRIGTSGGQSFASSTSGTWNRFFINANGTNGILIENWNSAEFDVVQVYQAHRIFYSSYTGVEFPSYVFPVVPDPEPEPEPTPELQSEKYYVRFGQQVGFGIVLLVGLYTIWLLRFRK